MKKSTLLYGASLLATAVVLDVLKNKNSNLFLGLKKNVEKKISSLNEKKEEKNMGTLDKNKDEEDSFKNEGPYLS